MFAIDGSSSSYFPSPSCSESVCFFSLRYCNKNCSFDTIRKALESFGTKPGQPGTLFAIKECLSSLGISTRAALLDYTSALGQPGAMILHARGTEGNGHFQFVSVADRKMLAYDPALDDKPVEITEDYFAKHMTGNALIIHGK